MATFVAKEYANWDRKDARFPFLRTFDIGPQGHSWAGGTSSPGGENQESSSEAVQRVGQGSSIWAKVLNDQEMMATGVMGYAAESEGDNELLVQHRRRRLPAGMETPDHRHGLERRKSVRHLLHRRPRLDLRHPMAPRLADALLPQAAIRPLPERSFENMVNADFNAASRRMPPRRPSAGQESHTRRKRPTSVKPSARHSAACMLRIRS